MQKRCSIILPCPGQYELLLTHEKGRKMKKWSSLIDDQNFLSRIGKIVKECLFGFSYFAHFGITKSFVLGQPLCRLRDLELMIPCLLISWLISRSIQGVNDRIGTVLVGIHTLIAETKCLDQRDQNSLTQFESDATGRLLKRFLPREMSAFVCIHMFLVISLSET